MILKAININLLAENQKEAPTTSDHVYASSGDGPKKCIDRPPLRMQI